MGQAQTAVAARPQHGPHWLLRTGPALCLLVLVSFVYNWYYLTGGFHLDDFFLLNVLRDGPLPYSRWAGPWSSTQVAAFDSIWWYEPEAMPRFWRPLPGLLFEGSVRLFGERAFPLHLLSILAHGLVAGLLFLFVRQVTGRPGVALLVSLVFLSCEDHNMTVGWIAAGTDIFCLLFVGLSLLAHVAWLQSRRPWALGTALALLIPALLSKESAVVAPIGMALLTFVMPTGRVEELPERSAPWLRDRARSFLRDALSWAPALAVLALYLGLYRLLGFGGADNGMYVDGLRDPGRYLGHLVDHLPVAWLATLSPMPASWVTLVPQTAPTAAVAGALAFAVWVGGLWSMRRNPLVVWAMLFYIVALLPQMSGPATGRVLYFPAVGSSTLVALLIMQIGPLARRTIPGAAPRSILTRLVGWTVLLSVFVCGAIQSALLYPFRFLPVAERLNAEVATIIPHLESRDPDYVLVLNTPGFGHTLYVQALAEYQAGRKVDSRLLSSVNAVVRVERIDSRSFALRADRAGWLTHPVSAALRSHEPPQPGSTYDEGILTATLLEMTADGRDVLAVRFETDLPVDDPSLLFVTWDGTGYRPIDLAALPVGQSVVLADTSDTWASFR